jgi:copper homeostasis protein
MLLEIAVFNPEGLLLALEAGAHRIELCSSYTEGGITASYGFLQWASKLTDTPIHPIIRPRGGHYTYTARELEVMEADIQLCRQLGFAGVVLGALTEKDEIDIPACQRLIKLAYPMEITFHRAFDRCRNKQQALDSLIELGVSRVLTSGAAPTAAQGKAELEALSKMADEGINIMPGGGIRLAELKTLAETGCFTEFHSAALVKGAANHSMGHPLPDKTEIQRMLQALQEHSKIKS